MIMEAVAVVMVLASWILARVVYKCMSIYLLEAAGGLERYICLPQHLAVYVNDEQLEIPHLRC